MIFDFYCEPNYLQRSPPLQNQQTRKKNGKKTHTKYCSFTSEKNQNLSKALVWSYISRGFFFGFLLFSSHITAL